MIATILILHVMVAPLLGAYSSIPEASLAALYGDHVAICKGDKIIYVKWSDLPKEHLPLFSSLDDEMITPSNANWLPPLLLGLFITGLGVWYYVASQRPIAATIISRRWMFWHGLIAHAPPR